MGAIALADTAALLFSIAVSVLLRFDEMPWPSTYQEYLQPHLLSLPLVLALYIAAFSGFHLYRCVWRFAGIEMLQSVVVANSMGLCGLVAAQLFIDNSTFPRSVIVMIWTAGIVTTGSLRVLLRVFSIGRRYERCPQNAEPSERRKRVIVLGAGSLGAQVLRTLKEDLTLNYLVVGFLDDDPRKRGTYIADAKILGPIDNLEALLAKHAVDEVIVALPETGGCRIRRMAWAIVDFPLPDSPARPNTSPGQT
jgi:FlaA1/EpsC-like NDP-sugar epimerase